MKQVRADGGGKRQLWLRCALHCPWQESRCRGVELSGYRAVYTLCVRRGRAGTDASSARRARDAALSEASRPSFPRHDPHALHTALARYRLYPRDCSLLDRLMSRAPVARLNSAHCPLNRINMKPGGGGRRRPATHRESTST